jgi:hypothetical protein
MANEESPDVRLQWPDGGETPARSGPTSPGAPPPASDARNLLRLRLPSDRSHSAELADRLRAAGEATVASDLARLVTEVARLRSEVDLLRRRVEDLELNDRHRTDIRDYSGDA